MKFASSIEQFAKSDCRIQQMVHWISAVLDDDIQSIEFASEDASFRRYFRILHNDTSYIVMDAPVENNDSDSFVRIAKEFLSIGLNVPEIFAYSPEQGYMLLTDFGKVTYLENLSNDTADELYDDALNSLIKLQKSTITDAHFPPRYDRKLLLSEMNLFREWYLPKRLNVSIGIEMNKVLKETFEFLICQALEQPRVWVHLDYHSRNLMLVEENNPGILDFQNAVLGPITYDLVSLLRDCYIVWPPDKVEYWLSLYLSKARSAGLPVGSDDRQFVKWFDWMGLQRHIKVVGIFSRLNYRDGKAKFLDDIPTVLDYIELVSSKYPELNSFHALIKDLRQEHD